MLIPAPRVRHGRGNDAAACQDRNECGPAGHDQEFSLGLSSQPKGTREGKGKKRPEYRNGKNTTL
ncbi:MAG: hypothetical protein IT261_13115 [Saprospiraceae bacterium]|nr:hypothetical protein [Saprospiraceae bacterium]